MLAVAYLRVSTEKQEVEAQRKAIEEFAKSRGFEVAWFIDEAVSGAVKAFERPGFSAMIRFLEANPHVKDIIVFELSRLGRDYDDLKHVLNYFSTHGYRLWIVSIPTWNQVMDTLRSSNDPLIQLLYRLLADIVVSVMAFASAQERILISIRTRIGMEKAKASGKHVGRPPYPFPVEEVRKLLEKGYSLKDVHTILVREGRICRKTSDNRVVCMSYETFRRKVKRLLSSR